MSENRPKPGDEIFPPSTLFQIGIVVKSIDETIRYFRLGGVIFELIQRPEKI